MKLKPPFPFDKQVQRLSEHGMLIAPEDNAEDWLREINYYRLSGYAFQFRVPNNNDSYLDLSIMGFPNNYAAIMSREIK